MAEKKGLLSRLKEVFGEPPSNENEKEIEEARNEGEQLATEFASKNFRESQKVELDTSSPVEKKQEDTEKEEQER